jgi:hypothetical protein
LKFEIGFYYEAEYLALDKTNRIICIKVLSKIGKFGDAKL